MRKKTKNKRTGEDTAGATGAEPAAAEILPGNENEPPRQPSREELIYLWKVEGGNMAWARWAKMHGIPERLPKTTTTTTTTTTTAQAAEEQPRGEEEEAE